jgi:hypothetical protein
MLSKITYFIAVFVLLITSFFYYPRWNKTRTEAAISWDVAGYYWYLPSVFIYKDLLHQAFATPTLLHYHMSNEEFDMATKAKNGNYVLKYSAGMAVMYLPFFMIGHAAAGILHAPQDGFSPPYQFCLQLGGLLAGIVGLWYFRKLFLRFFDDRMVALLLSLLVIGTNYLNYAAIDCGMTHTWLFTLYLLLLLNAAAFHESGKTKHAAAIGVLLGLLVLIRPSEIIAVLIPLLWGLNGLSGGAIKAHFAYLQKNVAKIVIAVVLAGAVFSLQLIYWKYSSGHWLYYSYGNQGFSFLHPHPMLYTFSYRSGWLVYTPLMVLAFLGLWSFVRKGSNKVAVTAFFLLNYYIICSWDVWDFGGRAMIQSYPILFFPLASFLESMNSKAVLRYATAAVVAVCIYMNIWITWQYHYGGLYDSQSMNQPYFWRVAGRWHVPEKTVVLKDQTELYEPEPKSLKAIYNYRFENDTDAEFSSHEMSTPKTFSLTRKYQASKDFCFPFAPSGERWIRVQATVAAKNLQYAEWDMSCVAVKLLDTTQKGDAAVVKKNKLNIDRLLKNELPTKITIDIKLPTGKFNKVGVSFFNQLCDRTLTVSDITAWSFIE